MLAVYYHVLMFFQECFSKDDIKIGVVMEIV